MTSAPSVTTYLPDLSGGGAERLHIGLAACFLSYGWKTDFLLDRKAGELLDRVPAGCAVHALGAKRQLEALPRLVRYLKERRPDILIVNMEHMNVMAVLAKRLARVPTRIIATQHNAFSQQVKRRSWQWRALPAIYRLTMPLADGLVCVSTGVADDLARSAGLKRHMMNVIHNGLVGDDFDARAAGTPDHPWFGDPRPVILGMGRLVHQKDFTTLIMAFAHVARQSDARLIILGEGPMRAELEATARSLGLADRVALPGFAENPLPSVRAARLFVMSSRFEGFGNVLAEALACGTPVVSTDCPHGPAEILDHGRFGDLVPVGDADALGKAMLWSLAREPDRAVLSERGRHFSVARCADGYRTLVERLLGGAA